VDESPHWEGGEPVGTNSDGTDRFRRTSYGINSYLTRLVTNDDGRPLYERVTQVPSATSTVHFLLMAETGDFAAADHPHAESWGVPGFSDAPLTTADREIAMAAHGGERQTWDAKSAYGFLDGHAELRRFEQVWNGTIFTPASDGELARYDFINAFDPKTAERVKK
jgi:hypothetical protein